MAKLEQVLEPHSTETPTCMCGEEMVLARVQPQPISRDAETREFHCHCGHVLRLAVWKSAA
jgi:hypothetical protein